MYLEDVQTLNQWAKEDKLNISKISYGVLPLVLDNYITLNSGGALGKGVGPLLIAKQEVRNTNSSASNFKLQISNFSVAIPGENTTAHMLFSLAFPDAKNKEFLVFNDIEQAVLSGRVDAGVIIHENRFTYQDKGLIKLMDLGDYWEQELQIPIPLGGIVAKRSLGKGILEKIDKLIKQSVEYAFANYPELTHYTKQHSQEMSESVMRQHIDLYVNNYSINLGDEGKKAVITLLEVYRKMHATTAIDTSHIFL